MKREKYKTSSHCVYLCQFHIVFCPKFRFGVLNSEIQQELKIIFSEISKRYDYEIIEMEIMSDHIHLFVGAKPSVAPSDIVRTFKSISAIEIFKKFDDLRDYYSRCGSLWSSGKFISSIGFVSADTIKKYIQEQKDSEGKE